MCSCIKLSSVTNHSLYWLQCFLYSLTIACIGYNALRKAYTDELLLQSSRYAILIRFSNNYYQRS